MALDLFKEFATNTAAEEAGVWTEYADGVEFLIARANNKSYSKLITKAFEKNKRILDTKGDAAESKSEEIIIDVMSRSLLLGWRGEFVWDGATLEYSVENAKKLLAVKDFRRWVAQKADDFNAFKLDQSAEDAGK